LRALLDTHTLIWWMTTDPHLSKPAHALIKNRDNTSLVSAVSAWEIRHKSSPRKAPAAADLIRNFVEDLTRSGLRFWLLPLNTVSAQACFPVHTKILSTGMLIAQALAENVPIVSNDRALDGYGVNRLW